MKTNGSYMPRSPPFVRTDAVLDPVIAVRIKQPIARGSTRRPKAQASMPTEHGGSFWKNVSR